MKYAAVIRNVGRFFVNHEGLRTFDEVMKYLDIRFKEHFRVNGCDSYEWLCKLGEYLDGTKFPCDKIVVDAATGYADKFALSFRYGEQKVCYIRLAAESYGRFEIDYLSFGNEAFKIFEPILRDYFDGKSRAILEDERKRLMAKCGFTEGAEVKSVLDEYCDYKKKREAVLCGTLEKIFDDYTTMNDQVRYCNGHYYRFSDNNVAKLYSLHVEAYKGNYFLDNAVRRGCLID